MVDFRRTCMGLVFLCNLCGCATPTATTDLIAIGRRGLETARMAEQQAHERIAEHHRAQQAALDAAFDADVRLAAAGQLKTADDKPVALSAEWIIAARKGYAAARSAMEEQYQAEQTAHWNQLDNLQAADEALQMANELIILQWNIGERFKQQFLKLTSQADNTLNAKETTDE